MSKKESDLASLQRVNDRLVSTKNEELASVLTLLLPKLIPMADDTDLNEAVSNIVNITVKPRLGMIVNLIGLSDIISLIQPDSQKQKSTSLALSFLDEVIDTHISDEKDTQCVISLVKVLPTFELFSSQSNAICYYLIHFLNVIPQVLNNMDTTLVSIIEKAKAQSILGDFLLDVMLLSSSASAANPSTLQSSVAVEIATTSVASAIQPGLSAARISRLTARRPQLYSHSELKTLKLRIIDSLPLNYLPPGYSVAIAVTGSCDKSSDQDVSTQAMYKVGGAMSLFRIEEGSEEQHHPVRVLEGLFTLCSASPAAPATASTALVMTNLNISRGKLRPEITIAVLRLVCKDLVAFLPQCMKTALSIAYKNVVASSSGDGHILITHTTLPVVAVSVKLLEELCARIDDPSLTLSTVIFLQAVKKVLTAYTFTLSATSTSNAGGANGSVSIANSTATNVNNNTQNSAPTEQDIAFSSTDYHLAVRSSCYAIVSQVAARNAKLVVLDIDLLVLLFKLLEREDERVLSRIYTALEGIRSAHQSVTDSSSSSASPSNPLLRDLITRARGSADGRQRLAAIQWVRALFQPSDAIVIETMVVLADDPGEHIKEAVRSEFDRLRRNLLAPTSDTAHSDVTHSVMTAIVSNAYVFRHSSSGTGAERPSLAAAYQLVKTINVALAAELNTSYKYGVSEASRAVNSNDHEQQDSLHAADRYVDIVLNKPVASGLIISPDLLMRVLSVVVKSTAAEAALDLERQQGVEATSTKTIASESSSHNAVFLNAQLIRQSVLMLRNALLLYGGVGSVEGAALRRACRDMHLAQHLMPYLVLPDATLSTHIAQCVAVLCACDSYVEGASGGAEGENEEDRVNYIASVVRLLSNKATSTANSSAVVKRTDNDSVVCGNAVRSLGALLEVLLTQLVALELSPRLRRSLAVEVQRVYHSTVCLSEETLAQYCEANKSHVAADGKKPSAPVAPSFTSEFLCTAALSVVSSLSSRGFLMVSIADAAASSGAEVLSVTPSTQYTRNIASTQAQLVRTLSAGDGSALRCTSSSLPTSLLTLLTSSLNQSVGVAAAGIDAITRLSLTGGVSVDFLSSVWSALLAKASQDSISSGVVADGVAATVLRFAAAEGLVRLSSIDLAATSEGVDLVERFSNGVPVMGASTLPVLLRILLSRIESAIVAADKTSTAVKSNYAVLLVVLIRQTFSASSAPLSVQDLKNVLAILLSYLREKDAFVQDMACLGLCHLYHLACAMTASDASLGGKSLSEYVAYEVTVVLTRQKRSTQPAGYSVAGEASAARTSENTASTAAQADTTNSRPPAASGGGAVAGGGGQTTAPPDPLALAAAAAAAELGLSMDDATAAAAPGGPQPEGNAFDSDYGVYSTICRVCKKTGDSTLLFTVLALIRRDVTLGSEDTSAALRRYQAPKTVISSSRLIALLPMLFHAKHNPNAVIRDLMKQLWGELLPEEAAQKALLLTHQTELMSYCVQQLVSNVWRDREAACSALESLLGLCGWETISAQVEQLYSFGLNVLDDVRHSTRLVSINYMKALATQLVRNCNPSEEGANPVAVRVNLDVVLTLLVTKGMLCPSEEGRGYSLGLLVKIITAAHRELSGAWLERLVSILIESMSALEPRTLQYMSFHTSRLSIKDEELEALRVKHSQASPMQEALTVCLQSLGGDNIAGVIQNIVAQLRGGVGLATRVVAVESLSYLIERYPNELRSADDDAADKTVQTLTIAEQHRASGITSNVVSAFRVVVLSLVSSSSMAVTLKKAMTAALGSLAKIVSKDLLATECDALITRYNALSAADSHQSGTIAGCLLQVVSRAGDRIEGSAVWNKLLTVGYVGSFDSDLESQNVWQKIYADALIGSGCGNKQTAVGRILSLLVPVVEQYVVDLSWLKRAQGLGVLRDVLVVSSTPALSAALSSQLGRVVGLLLTGLRGRIWSHQGLVLETISDIVTKCHQNLTCGVDSVNDDGDAVVLTLGLKGAEQIVYTLSSLTTGAANTASVTTPEVRWEVSALGLCRLLLHECVRGSSGGNKEYSLHGARAVNALPWARITTSNPAVFCALYSTLSRHANIFVVLTAEESSASAASALRTAASESAKLKASKAASSGGGGRGMNSSALFGNRYGSGSSGPPSSSSSGQRVRQIRRLNGDVSVSGGASSPTAVESAESLANEEEEKEGEEVMDVVVVETDASEVQNLSLADSASPSHVMDVESSSSSSSSAPPVTLLSADPAYRMLFLEALCKGMPDLVNCSEAAEVARTVPNLLEWVRAALKTEVWSVRRVAIQLVGAVAGQWDFAVLSEAEGVMDDSQQMILVRTVLDIVTGGLDEVKYVKIRVEALRSLRAMLGCEANKRFLQRNVELNAAVCGIIRTGSADTQPTILEEVAKVQQVWIK